MVCIEETEGRTRCGGLSCAVRNRKIRRGVLRNDYRGSVGVLSTSQLISIGAVIGGIVLYFAAPKLAGVGNVAEEKSVG